MRKVGLLSDAEHLKNKDFKQTQLAERELIASRLPKARGLGKKLKYTERVPTRVPGGLVRDNLRSTLTGIDGRERSRGATGGPPAAFPPPTPELVPDESTDSEPEEIEDTRLAVREDTLESLEESDVEIEDTRLAVQEDTLESPEESDVEFEDTRLAVQEDTLESPEESEAEDALTPTESDAESVVSLLAPTEIESDGEPPELVSDYSTDDDFVSADELEETPPEPTESEPESQDTLPDRAAESEDTLPDRPREPYEDYESEDTLPDRPGEPYENYESEDTQNRGETYYDGEPYDPYEPYDGEPYEPYVPQDPYEPREGYNIYDSLPAWYGEEDRSLVSQEYSRFNPYKRPNDDHHREPVKRQKTTLPDSGKRPNEVYGPLKKQKTSHQVIEREMPLDQTPEMDRTEPPRPGSVLRHGGQANWVPSALPGHPNRPPPGDPHDVPPPVIPRRDREMPSMPSQVEAFQRPRLGDRLHNVAPGLPAPLATPKPKDLWTPRKRQKTSHQVIGREMPLNQTPEMDQTEPPRPGPVLRHGGQANWVPSALPGHPNRPPPGDPRDVPPPVIPRRDRGMPSMPSQVEAFQRPRLGSRWPNAAPELPTPAATPKPKDLWTPSKRQKLTDDEWVYKRD